MCKKKKKKNRISKLFFYITRHRDHVLANRGPGVSVGLAWRSFSTTANPPKRLPTAANTGTTEPASSPTRGS